MEDVVGFGLLRFVLDGLRGWWYGTGEFNWPAARERGLREGLSILTDIFIPGWAGLGIGAVAGWGAGTLAAQSAKALTKNVVPTSSMRVLQHVTQHATSLEDATERFAQTLSDYWKPHASATGITAHNATGAIKDALMALNSKVLQGLQGKERDEYLVEMRATLAKKLGLTQLDGVLDLPHLREETLRLTASGEEGLLEHFTTWTKSVAAKAKTGLWSPALKADIHAGFKQGLRIRGWQVGGLLVGLISTMLSPLLINAITRKLDHRNDYPALQGLTRPPASAAKNDPLTGLKGWFNQQFPYVSQSLGKGNPLPLIGALIPMVVALTLDTVNVRFARPTGKRLLSLLDFGKMAPHTMQQQIATLFGFLITARLLSTREKTEYRERAVDSGLGWVMWILGTPFFTRMMAKKSQNADLLMKTVGPWSRSRLRSLADLKLLKGQLPEATLNALLAERNAIGRKALLLNIGLLGIAEPIVSTLWSRSTVEAEAKKAWAPVIKRLVQYPNEHLY